MTVIFQPYRGKVLKRILVLKEFYFSFSHLDFFINHCNNHWNIFYSEKKWRAYVSYVEDPCEVAINIIIIMMNFRYKDDRKKGLK